MKKKFENFLRLSVINILPRFDSFVFYSKLTRISAVKDVNYQVLVADVKNLGFDSGKVSSIGKTLTSLGKDNFKLRLSFIGHSSCIRINSGTF